MLMTPSKLVMVLENMSMTTPMTTVHKRMMPVAVGTQPMTAPAMEMLATIAQALAPAPAVEVQDMTATTIALAVETLESTAVVTTMTAMHMIATTIMEGRKGIQVRKQEQIC